MTRWSCTAFQMVRSATVFKMVEGNAIHLARCVEVAREHDATCVEIRQPAHERYFRNVQWPQHGTVVMNHRRAAAHSYYFDRRGDAPMRRPSTSFRMLWRAKRLPMKHYRFQHAAAPGKDSKQRAQC